jgi:invasion protein IalB
VKTYCIFAALALVSTSASAQQQPQAAPAEAAPKEEKKICRSERATGSLTRVNRICMTKAEWDQLAESTRKNIGDISRQAGTNTSGGASAGPAGF